MILKCKAIIFDLDGVLVDSQQVVEKHWSRWAEQQNLDPEEVIETVHGRRPVDSIAKLKPELDAQEEARKLAEEESTDTEGLKVYPGVKETLESLPVDRWAVATSGTNSIATTRLSFAEIQEPPVFITAEDVENGKPNPEIFLQAAKRLGMDPSEVLVFEDSPAGIDAALQADMKVVAVHTTHEVDQINKATAIVPDLGSVDIKIDDDESFTISLKNTIG